MSVKQSNEITVKIKCDIEEFYKLMQERRAKIIKKFSMVDSYYIPENLDIENMSTREILSKAILIRDIHQHMPEKAVKKITFKIKDFDEKGDIISQQAISCNILKIEEAKQLLQAIGYREIMIIRENDVETEIDGLQFAIKDIENGDKLIEVETGENENFDTIEKLVNKINGINIPIYTDNYFVKKAEIELDKVLKR